MGRRGDGETRRRGDAETGESRVSQSSIVNRQSSIPLVSTLNSQLLLIRVERRGALVREGNLDEDFTAALLGIAQAKDVLAGIKGLQPPADVAQADPSGSRSGAFTESRPIVADGERELRLLGAGPDRDADASRARVRRVLDGVLHQRLEHEARDIGRARGLVRVDLDPDSVVEAHALDLEVLLEDRQVLLKRYELPRLGEEARTEQVRDPQDHALGAAGLAADERQERVQGVEQEVGLQLRLERRELGFDDCRPESLVRRQPPKADPVEPPGESRGPENAEGAKPGGLGKGSLERHAEDAAVAAPDAVLVAGLDVEGKSARRQIRVVSDPAGSRVDPALVEAFQPVLEKDCGRIAERERGALQLESFYRGGQVHPFLRRKPPPARRDGLDDDLRRHRIQSDGPGGGHREPLPRREPPAAVAAAEAAVLAAVAFNISHPVGRRETDGMERAAVPRGRRVELRRTDAEDAVVARQPQVALVVGQNFLDRVVKEALLLPVGREFARLPPGESPARAEPERSGVVLEDRHDDVVREAVARGQVPELAVLETAHAAAEGADPHGPAPVLEDREDGVAGEPVLVRVHG